MALYVLSDTHLSLTAEKPMDIFGGRWQGHAEKIRKNWTNLVTDADTVVVPGDISWGMNLDEAGEDLIFLAQLPGKKIFLRGNHDYFWTSLAKMKTFFAERGYDNIDFIQNNALSEQGFVLAGSRGWYIDPADMPRNADYEKVWARENIRLHMSLEEAQKAAYGREIIAFFHFPPVFGAYKNENTLSLLHEFGVRRVYYGHIHGNYIIPPVRVYEDIAFHIVSADYLNFIPQIIN